MPPEELESLAAPVNGPDVALLEAQRWAWIVRTLATFSERDRRFAHLYYDQAMAPKEIARKMGISVCTVYSKKAKLERRLTRMAVRAA